MAGYSYPDKVLDSFEQNAQLHEKNRELHKERVAGIISAPPTEPLKPGEEAGTTPQKHMAHGRPSGPTVTRDEYIRSLKVKSAVEAIAKFQEDVKSNAVPGDADDVSMAAFMVYRLMERQATISKTHGYFMPSAVKDGMAWLQLTFNVGPSTGAAPRELSANDPVGATGDQTRTSSPPPNAGSWGIPVHDPRADIGTVEDSNPSDPIGSIMEAEMRKKFPDMFASMDAAGTKEEAPQKKQGKQPVLPGAPGPRGPLDRPQRAAVGAGAGDAFSSGYATNRDDEGGAMPGADTELPFTQGSPALQQAGEDADPTAPPTFGTSAPWGSSDSPGGGGGGGGGGGAGGVAGLNETLSKLSGQMGGMPSGEGGGIYDMQEGMNVALPSDEDEEGPGGNDWGTGETGYGGGGGGGATMQQGYGAPTGAPPGQPEPAARPVWNRTEEGRKEMEALGEILAERVIGQEAAVDMVATTMQMCYVGLQASSGKKTGFLSHLYVKVIFLPRQARDKHREDSKKARFLEGPLGVFLFVGPSGVGKTELAKALAAQLFGEETDMFRVDMSGFKAKGDVATLIGAPKGYQARKRHFLSHLYIKCIILPRQARDEHRENSKKSAVFPLRTPRMAVP